VKAPDSGALTRRQRPQSRSGRRCRTGIHRADDRGCRRRGRPAATAVKSTGPAALHTGGPAGPGTYATRLVPSIA